jgi:ribosomal-protein-alanine N-acetyltransferase
MNISNNAGYTPVLNKSVFHSFPVLESEHLCLREINESDAEKIFEWYSNPLVMQYRGADCFCQQKEAELLIRSFKDQFDKQEGIRWGLVFKDRPQELIGTAGLKSIILPHLRSEIGYELDPLHWNKGLMTEALRAITRFSFQELQLHTLEANIAPDNLASERVLQKLGFVKEAHFRENWYYKGWWDSVIYTMHAKD